MKAADLELQTSDTYAGIYLDFPVKTSQSVCTDGNAKNKPGEVPAPAEPSAGTTKGMG